MTPNPKPFVTSFVSTLLDFYGKKNSTLEQTSSASADEPNAGCCCSSSSSRMKARESKDNETVIGMRSGRLLHLKKKRKRVFSPSRAARTRTRRARPSLLPPPPGRGQHLALPRHQRQPDLVPSPARVRHRRVVPRGPALHPAVLRGGPHDQPRLVRVGRERGKGGVDVLPRLEPRLRADPRADDDAARGRLVDRDARVRFRGRRGGPVFRGDEEGDGGGAVAGEAGELFLMCFFFWGGEERSENLRDLFVR